jgi:hypothetical protein
VRSSFAGSNEKSDSPMRRMRMNTPAAITPVKDPGCEGRVLKKFLKVGLECLRRGTFE